MVATPWTLVKTITAFTIAHSMTLAAATLGYVAVPAPPVEATVKDGIQDKACCLDGEVFM